MAMTMRDFRVLEKTMAQTTSENDHEALAALRQANGLLAKYNYTWADAFGRLVRVLPDPSVPDVEDGADTIPRDHGAAREDAWIDDAFNRLDAANRLNSFLYSLRDQWGNRRFLTPKQQAALRKNVDEL